MKLFFETSSQAVSFLAAIPIGVLVCLCLCSAGSCGLWRLILDLAVLVCSASAFFFLFVMCQNVNLRFYHLLGVVLGAFLCLRGIGTLLKAASETIQRFRQESRREKPN